MAAVDRIRVAVSGTYASGKTTTAQALAYATGFPRTHAMTSREILLELMPGKRVEELSAAELIALGLRRLEERIHHEAAQSGSFISDGSVIHEWIYGEARIRVGINPSAGVPRRILNGLVTLPFKRFYQQYLDAYGVIVKQRAKRSYDVYVHLPVEFDMQADGHRPVSEPFRNLSDKLMIATLDELQIPYYVVGGTIRQRVEQIVNLLDLPLVRPLDEAIEMAVEKVKHDTEILEADADLHRQQLAQSWRKSIRYSFRH